MNKHSMEHKPEQQPKERAAAQPEPASSASQPKPAQPKPREAAPPQVKAPQPETPRTEPSQPERTNLPLRKPVNKGMDKRMKLLIAAGSVAAVIVIALCVWFFGLKGYFAAQNAAPVYVSSVSSITGVLSGTDPRYSGLVEPQKVTKVNKDDSKTVAEVMVTEGQQVYVGDVLFSYDTDEMQLAIRQAELELEGISNQLTILNDQKATLEKEKKDASKDEQFRYTVEIQSAELQIKTQEYQRSVKQTELEKLQDSLNNNQVFSEVEGVVQQVNLTPTTDPSGQPQPFISILSSGEYRVKGTITELNLGALSEGQSVTVRSRVDPNAYWTGIIDTIEHEPTQDNQNNFYYSGMDSGNSASKYNFFVTLDYPDGLMLGQHVYIEPDAGQSARREGLWLPSMYIVDPKEGAGYVWARNDDDKLELRSVMLGEYDEAESLYQIVSGLELSDYIAYPTESLVAGGPTTTDASAMTTPDDSMGGVADPGMDGMVPEAGGDNFDALTDSFEPSDTLDGEAIDGTADGAVPEGEDGGEPVQ